MGVRIPFRRPLRPYVLLEIGLVLGGRTHPAIQNYFFHIGFVK